MIISVIYLLINLRREFLYFIFILWVKKKVRAKPPTPFFIIFIDKTLIYIIYLKVNLSYSIKLLTILKM